MDLTEGQLQGPMLGPSCDLCVVPARWPLGILYFLYIFRTRFSSLPASAIFRVHAFCFKAILSGIFPAITHPLLQVVEAILSGIFLAITHPSFQVVEAILPGIVLAITHSD